MSLADVEVPVGNEDSGPILNRSTDEAPRTFQTVHLRKDGTTFPVEVHVTSVGIGTQRLLLTIVRDITDHKPAEGYARKRTLFGRHDAAIDRCTRP